jgi:hypothetical protein
MRFFANIAFRLATLTTLGKYAVMGEVLWPIILVAVLLVAAVVAAVGWVVLTYLTLMGIIGMVIGAALVPALYPR